MTRCRCGECGAVLAFAVSHHDKTELTVYPCGACLQEARSEGVQDGIEQHSADLRELEQEGRD